MAFLQLRTVLDKQTIGDVEDALSNLSGSLPDAFEGTIARISQAGEGKRRIGLTSLMWICHSQRPLAVEELREVLSIEIGQADRRPKHRPFP